MNFSDMKDRITFLNPPNDDGINLDPPYNPYCTVWAKVEYLKGREFWSAKAVNAEQSIRFIIRYRKDITTKMRVKFAGTENELNITSVAPLDNQKRWLLVIAKDVNYSG